MLKIVQFRLSNDVAKGLHLLSDQLSKNLVPPSHMLVGALQSNGKVLDFRSVAKYDSYFQEKLGSGFEVISSGNVAVQRLKKLLISTEFTESKDKIVWNMNQIRLDAPIYPKRNITCIGKNYLEHINEVQKADAMNVTKTGGVQSSDSSAAAVAKQAYQYPVFFTKSTSTVLAPGGVIENHKNLTKFLDYEAELAVIIGKAGKNILAKDAFDHVFGYTIANDITARDIQKRHNQWYKGKSLDTTCPLGPYIIHASDINPSVDLSIKLWLNDDLKQNSRTSNMIHKIPDIIQSLSEGTTLLPGDVILTGTPEGVGFAATPPTTLQPSDRVRIEIEGLGVLENTVES